MNQVLVYDYTDTAGPLFAMAEALKFNLIREADQKVAVSKLLDSNAQTLLVHVDNEPWMTLVQGSDRIAKINVFRFSTHGFPPTHPCGTEKNCFHVNLPTSGEEKFSKAQLEEFIRVVGQPAVVALLRHGSVPSVLRPFIQFEQLHLARALHIVLQARIGQWAGDHGHPLQDEARRLLGFDNQVVAPIGGIDWPGTLRKVICNGIAEATIGSRRSSQKLIDIALDQIRRELGHKKDSWDPPIRLINDALKKVFSALPASSGVNEVLQHEKELFLLFKESIQELGKSLGLPQRDGK